MQNEGDKRKLCIDVFPRVWSDDQKSFKADSDVGGSDRRSFKLEISNWQRPTPHPSLTNNSEEVASMNNSSENSKEMPQTPEREVKNPARRLTYRFLSLSYQTRLGIAQKLDLIRDEDEGIDDSERYARFFARARTNQRLGELWEAVEQAHGGTSKATNPFKGI